MTPEILRRVCSWCQVVMTVGTPGAATSHGMCDRCAKAVNDELDAAEAA